MECKHEGYRNIGLGGQNYCPLCVADDRISILEAQLKDREWISVDKCKPENVKDVLVFSNDIVFSWVDMAWYSKEAGAWCEAGKEEDYVPIITHWMPLPSPPKEQDNVPTN